MAESLHDEILDHALRLPEGDRVQLARRILESVEHFALTEAQRAELCEAMAEIDRGACVDEEMFLRELGVLE